MSTRCDWCGRAYDRDPLHFDCATHSSEWGPYATWVIGQELARLTLQRGGVA